MLKIFDVFKIWADDPVYNDIFGEYDSNTRLFYVLHISYTQILKVMCLCFDQDLSYKTICEIFHMRHISIKYFYIFEHLGFYRLNIF